MPLFAKSSRKNPTRRPRSSRLLLLIDETLYWMRPLRSDPPAATRAFRLGKEDGTFYDVAQTGFGPVCDCPDFIFRRDGLDPEGCKHVKALVAQGLMDATSATPRSSR